MESSMQRAENSYIGEHHRASGQKVSLWPFATADFLLMMRKFNLSLSFNYFPFSLCSRFNRFTLENEFNFSYCVHLYARQLFVGANWFWICRRHRKVGWLQSKRSWNLKWLDFLHFFRLQGLFNKNFQMEFREDRRRKAFEENMEKIRQHNEEFRNGKHSFKLSPNDLADLSNQQYLRHYVRLVNSQFDLSGDADYVLASQYDGIEYPATLDWREKGFITRPCNQKSCGSCYAFSIAKSVEGQLFKKLNRIIELSPQQVSHKNVWSLRADESCVPHLRL